MIARVAAAARASGRRPEEIRVVAVTKTVDPEDAAALARLGTSDLGESRVDELERKREWFAEHGLTARWHFVGHLQRNKARRVVRIADQVHSVDSIALLDALERLAEEEGRAPGIFLQVKLSDEPTKTGVSREGFSALFARAERSALPLLGLMTLAPPLSRATSAHAVRSVFRALADLARSLPPQAFEEERPLLSMGMSADFEHALAEGADVLRIGNAFFEGIPGTRAPAGPAEERR